MFGTIAVPRPVEIVIVIVVRVFTVLAANRVLGDHLPLGLVGVALLDVRDQAFRAQRALTARSCCWPTTEGTWTSLTPLETTRITRLLRSSSVPAGGSVSIARPARTVVEGLWSSRTPEPGVLE